MWKPAISLFPVPTSPLYLAMRKPNIPIEKVKKSLKMRLIFTIVFGAMFAFSILTVRDAYDIATSGEIIIVSGILFVLLLFSSIERLVYLAKSRKGSYL